MLSNIIQQSKNTWLQAEDNAVAGFIKYISEAGKLRAPQIEAIETYLFLKIAGQNKPLWQLLAEGFFSKNDDLNKHPLTQAQRELFEKNTAARALYELPKELEGLRKLVLGHGETLDCEQIIRKLFNDVEYTDYLFSLPMGAGKTYLMAAFIYIDLYFAQNEPENPAFAHNFIVLAPSGLKSSIVPSLKTIEQFDPTWVLPEPVASDLKRKLKFEILDQPKAAAKSNRAKNPNAQKVAAFQPFDDMFGAVMVVNAEKVILDKVEAGKNPTLFEKNADEKEKAANELRHLIGEIPNLSILIDEVHHAATDDIKLRQVVRSWNEKGTVTTVLGFSGTPYLSGGQKLQITEGVEVKQTQIPFVVYYFPLLKAIESFLKKPLVRVEKGTNVQPLDIIRTGVTTFYERFGDTTYADGTTAKLAIYCSSIEKLEEEIYPFLVGSLQIPPADILKYHQGNKSHKIPKENQTEFANLDTSASRKKIVLLVQIGKEGWDCRSLTGVVLSQKGDCPTNMVLQTACRCLRQIHYPGETTAPEKTALICLNEDNEKSLDKQLKDEQQTSLAEISNAKNKAAETPTRPRFDRRQHLQLPKIEFYQLKVHFEQTDLEADPNTVQKIQALQKTEHRAVQIEDRELQNGSTTTRQFRDAEAGEPAHFQYWLLQISKESFNSIAVADLRRHEPLLREIFQKITFENPPGTRVFNERFPLAQINAGIRKAFHRRRELRTREEVIRREAELLLVQNLRPVPVSDLLVPSEKETQKIIEADASGKPIADATPEQLALLEKMRQDLIAQGLGDMAQNLAAPPKPTLFERQKDQTFHLAPYRFDSRLEKNFLENALQDADFQQLGLEIYFNGEDALTEFSIDCYQKRDGDRWRRLGQYFPDFLMLQRSPSPNGAGRGEVKKILIIETKGEGFARNFEEKKTFMETQFLKNNNSKFGYQRFDFLYLQDDDPQILQKLNSKIKSFFAEPDVWERVKNK